MSGMSEYRTVKCEEAIKRLNNLNTVIMTEKTSKEIMEDIVKSGKELVRLKALYLKKLSEERGNE